MVTCESRQLSTQILVTHLLLVGYWPKSVMEVVWPADPAFSSVAGRKKGRLLLKVCPLWCSYMAKVHIYSHIPPVQTSHVSHSGFPKYLISQSIFLFGPMNQVYKAKHLQQERFGAVLPHHSTQLCNDWWRLQSYVEPPLWLKEHKRLRLGFSHICVVGSQAKRGIFWSCLGVSVPPAAVWQVLRAVSMFQSQDLNLGSQVTAGLEPHCIGLFHQAADWAWGELLWEIKAEVWTEQYNRVQDLPIPRKG